MPKKTPSTPATEQSRELATDEQLHLAIKCICAVTGCGTHDAEARAKKMGEAKLAKLAKLEAAGNRRAAVPILYG